jgi:ribosome biogenesis GTPase
MYWISLNTFWKISEIGSMLNIKTLFLCIPLAHPVDNMGAGQNEGLVVRVTGGEVWVNVDGDVVPCQLRGRFRQKGQGIQVVAGDRVEVSPPSSEGAQGAIEALKPRSSWLSRYTGGRSATEKVIVANIDVLFVVVSVRSPALHYGFVDRVLVSAERGHNNIKICLNKVDLDDTGETIEEFSRIYTAIGYAATRCSAKSGEGVSDIESLLQGGVYAFVGQSGVGKSSLLNRIDPDLNLKVARVAGKTGRGRHTTTFSQLYPINGGWVADTPGMQTFGFPGSEKQELSDCFPEFRPFLGQCQFAPCTHSHEPGCAVKAAGERGHIAATRLESYEYMLSEVIQREKHRY